MDIDVSPQIVAYSIKEYWKNKSSNWLLLQYMYCLGYQAMHSNCNWYIMHWSMYTSDLELRKLFYKSTALFLLLLPLPVLTRVQIAPKLQRTAIILSLPILSEDFLCIKTQIDTLAISKDREFKIIPFILDIGQWRCNIKLCFYKK